MENEKLTIEHRENILTSNISSEYFEVERILNKTIMMGVDYRKITQALNEILSITNKRIKMRDERIQELEQQLSEVGVDRISLEKDIVLTRLYDLATDIRKLGDK